MRAGARVCFVSGAKAAIQPPFASSGARFSSGRGTAGDVPPEMRVVAKNVGRQNAGVALVLCGFIGGVYFYTVNRWKQDPILNQRVPTQEQFQNAEHGIKGTNVQGDWTPTR